MNWKKTKTNNLKKVGAMAKLKNGLDYFSFDVDFFSDEKIEFVSARFGLKGEIIAIKLLCKIYRNGYYIEWSEDDATIFAKRVGDGVTPALVNDVVEELAKRGFFDKDILSRFRVLTSKGIQYRYLEAVERRKSVDVCEHLRLLDIEKYDNVNILKDNVYINNENDNILKQSKVTESKVTESKVSRANALVGRTSDKKIRNDYNMLFEGLREKEKKDQWNDIKNFISNNKPQFIEPYVDCWNIFVTSSRMKAYGLAVVESINNDRRKKFKARISEDYFDFLKVLEKIKSSPHLRGYEGGWKVSFDWILKNDSNYIKVIEGNYD